MFIVNKLTSLLMFYRTFLAFLQQNCHVSIRNWLLHRQVIPVTSNEEDKTASVLEASDNGLYYFPGSRKQLSTKYILFETKQQGERNGKKERGMARRREEWQEGEWNGKKERGMARRREEWQEGERNGKKERGMARRREEWQRENI